MRKLLVAALFTFGWGLVSTVPAVAGGNSPTPCFGPQTSTCTYTQNIHVAQTFPANVPCVDPAMGPPTGMLTIDGNSVFHDTVNTAGDEWLTGTTEGALTFIPFDPKRVSYTGHAQSWFGFSFNMNNSVLHDTLNVRATGSDGSTLTAHIIDHMSISASGITLTFDNIVC
jgi:hypothetical protein